MFKLNGVDLIMEVFSVLGETFKDRLKWGINKERNLEIEIDFGELEFEEENQSELRRNLSDDFEQLSNLDEKLDERDNYKSFDCNVVNSIDPKKSFCEKSDPNLIE